MSNPRPIFISFNTAQQAEFIRRLALYLRAGIPITRALIFIIADTKSTTTRYLLSSLERTITSGLPLSRALAVFPKHFDTFSVGFINAGEASGTLAETLERLAIYLQKRSSLRKKIMGALAYPALIFCGTVGIALFLTLYIFPKIVPVLKGFHTALPLTTRILIALNTAIAQKGLLMCCVFGMIVCAMLFSLRFSRVQKVYEQIFLHIPLFSKLFQYYAIATFSRTLSLQLKGGVRILTALALVRTAIPGITFSQAVRDMEERIAHGERLSVVLRAHKRLFPTVVSQMIAAGEATGTLSANLESLADLYEEYLDEFVRNLTILIEPILMICMGFVVGFIALAIITPIYAITQNLNTH